MLANKPLTRDFDSARYPRLPRVHHDTPNISTIIRQDTISLTGYRLVLGSRWTILLLPLSKCQWFLAISDKIPRRREKRRRTSPRARRDHEID